MDRIDGNLRGTGRVQAGVAPRRLRSVPTIPPPADPDRREPERLPPSLRWPALGVAALALVALLLGLRATIGAYRPSIAEVLSLDPPGLQVLIPVGLAALIGLGALLVARFPRGAPARDQALAAAFLVLGLGLLVALLQLFSSLLAPGH